MHEFQLGEIGFGLAKIFPDGDFLLGGSFFQIIFQVGDFLGHGDDFVFDAGNTDALNVLTGGLGGNDLDAGGPGAGIGFVALIVVPVEMGVDDEFHGLGSEFLDLLDEGASGGRLGVGVDDKHTVAKDDDGGVAIDFVSGLSDGGVDAVGDGLDVEEIFARDGGGEAGDGEQEEKKKREARFHGRDLRLLE